MKHFNSFLKKNTLYFTVLFLTASFTFGQNLVPNTVLANNGSSKNHVWVIGTAANGTISNPNDPDFGNNNNSKNGSRADVLLGPSNLIVSGITCSNITLNAAINAALAANNNKIYIQEGLYYVDGPIVIEGRYNGTNFTTNGNGYANNISIEGEGFGTRIAAAAGYTGPIFQVKSEFNTIRNLSILIEPTGAKTGIEIKKDNTAWTVPVSGTTTYPGDQRYNIFENLYIGHWNRTNYTAATDVAGVYGIVLENSNNTRTAIAYNKFKNITIHGVESGILFKKSSTDPLIWSQDNIFEDFDINQAVRAIDISTAGGSQPVLMRNTFRRFTFQTVPFSNLVVNKVYGNDNIFDDFKIADWASQNSGIPEATRRIFVLTENAKNTVISNSTVVSLLVHGGTNDVEDPYVLTVDSNTGLGNYDTTKRTYTQLINNSRSGVNYTKIGHFNANLTGSEKSLTEIEGRLRLTAESGNAGNDTLLPTFGTGKVLTSDAKGYATWQTLGSLAWDHSATKNIKMNGFALTNNSNAVPNTNTDAGLRLDNSGNVRIGTSAPEATNPAKLQVDGRVIVGNTSTDVGSIDPTYNLIVNGKAYVKSEVLIKSNAFTWPDYVFKNNYRLMPLQEVENCINTEGHLPNMPTAAQIENDGLPLSEMILKQQEKIEELTLYLIELKKKIEALEQNQKN